jgi:hypothetical protein
MLIEIQYNSLQIKLHENSWHPVKDGNTDILHLNYAIVSKQAVFINDVRDISHKPYFN